MRRTFLILAAAWLAASLGFAQGRGRGRGPAQSPKAAAPIDMTGWWVSVVTEDWRYRMVTPPKGAYGGVPMNAESRKLAEAWDPAKDEAAGQQCKSYGAAGVMRLPGRLHITWQDDNTLKIEADAGQQTRTFHFAGPVPANIEPSWQGYSTAQWEFGAASSASNGTPGAPGGRGDALTRTGNLKVVTTKMLPGYVRKNGVPYSANAVLTEWYDRIRAANGDEWLVVMTEVNDPQYFSMPFTTTTHFKKEADGSKFAPEPCSAK
jgi:hypothetical protein